MLPRLTAVQFERFMSTGRTSPALCGCEDQTGTYVGEYVVKLRGAIGLPGLLNELFAAGLARHFGIASPDPALVAIERELGELIAGAQPAQAARIRGSVGLNFGTTALTGVTIWPVDKNIPEAMWQAAVDIFAFDALIQNPDRRYDNPNLFTKADSLLVFDHETAFSFLRAILPPAEPWKLEGERYLTDHVFYRRLKSKPLDLTGFTARLVCLSDGILSDIVADAPAEWNNGTGHEYVAQFVAIEKMQQHLRTVRDRADDFAREVQRILV